MDSLLSNRPPPPLSREQPPPLLQNFVAIRPERRAVDRGCCNENWKILRNYGIRRIWGDVGKIRNTRFNPCYVEGIVGKFATISMEFRTDSTKLRSEIRDKKLCVLYARREKMNYEVFVTNISWIISLNPFSILQFQINLDRSLTKERKERKTKRETTTRSINVSRYLKSNRIKFSSPTSQDVQLEDVKPQTEARQRETTKHEIAKRETSLRRRRSPRWFSLFLSFFLFSLRIRVRKLSRGTVVLARTRKIFHIYIYTPFLSLSISLSFCFFLIFFL